MSPTAAGPREPTTAAHGLVARARMARVHGVHGHVWGHTNPPQWLLQVELYSLVRCRAAHSGPKPTSGRCWGEHHHIPAQRGPTRHGPARESQPAALPDMEGAEGLVSSCHRLPDDLQKRKKATAQPQLLGTSRGSHGDAGAPVCKRHGKAKPWPGALGHQHSHGWASLQCIP